MGATIAALKELCESRAADCCLEGMNQQQCWDSIHDMVLDTIADHPRFHHLSSLAISITTSIMGERPEEMN